MFEEFEIRNLNLGCAFATRCNFSGANLVWADQAYSHQIGYRRQYAATRLFVESMCRGKDDCSACRFDKFSRSNPAIQYPVDVENKDIRFLFTNADMEATRAP